MRAQHYLVVLAARLVRDHELSTLFNHLQPFQHRLLALSLVNGRGRRPFRRIKTARRHGEQLKAIFQARLRLLRIAQEHVGHDEWFIQPVVSVLVELAVDQHTPAAIATLEQEALVLRRAEVLAENFNPRSEHTVIWHRAPTDDTERQLRPLPFTPLPLLLRRRCRHRLRVRFWHTPLAIGLTTGPALLIGLVSTTLGMWARRRCPFEFIDHDPTHQACGQPRQLLIDRRRLLCGHLRNHAIQHQPG